MAAEANPAATIAHKASMDPGLDAPEQRRSNKASDHGPNPVKRDKACRCAGVETRDLRQGKIHQETSD
jgi:hypothetical protein